MGHGQQVVEGNTWKKCSPFWESLKGSERRWHGRLVLRGLEKRFEQKGASLMRRPED
jgi:hypothetical protein